MKGYTIQHSIELLEKQAGSGSGGASTAAQVSYDNTGTSLVATNVQSAIDEVAGDLGTLSTTVSNLSDRFDYSTTEKIVGKWIGGSDLYQITVDCGALPNNTDKTVAHNISGIDRICQIEGISRNPTSGVTVPLPFATTVAVSNMAVWADNTNIYLKTASDGSAYSDTHVTLRYTKTVPEANTRSRKKKEE